MAPIIFLFSPTAESFGVSAQKGSGVVRGDPELRFHQGSPRIPPGFHQGSTRVPPGFHQVLRGLRGGPGWFEVRFHYTKVPPEFHQVLPGLRGGPGWFEVRFHYTKVPPEFRQVLQGLRGGPGWFEVRFHEGSTRVPPGSTNFFKGCGVVRAGLRKVPREFHQSSTSCKGCGVVRAGLR